jgi:hypothetical protein
MAASAEAVVAGSVFSLPFAQYTEQEALDLARACPGGLFVPPPPIAFAFYPPPACRFHFP